MLKNAEQSVTLDELSQITNDDRVISVPADAIYCAYCGVVILPAERRAQTANYFARWGYLHDACENAMEQQLLEEACSGINSMSEL